MADNEIAEAETPRRGRPKGSGPKNKHKNKGAGASGTILTAELRDFGRDQSSAETASTSPREKLISGLLIAGRNTGNVMREYGITRAEMRTFMLDWLNS